MGPSAVELDGAASERCRERRMLRQEAKLG
jgi:hypothetical protein